jgi:hypothetical protein
MNISVINIRIATISTELMNTDEKLRYMYCEIMGHIEKTYGVSLQTCDETIAPIGMSQRDFIILKLVMIITGQLYTKFERIIDIMRIIEPNMSLTEAMISSADLTFQNDFVIILISIPPEYFDEYIKLFNKYFEECIDTRRLLYIAAIRKVISDISRISNATRRNDILRLQEHLCHTIEKIVNNIKLDVNSDDEL